MGSGSLNCVSGAIPGRGGASSPTVDGMAEFIRGAALFPVFGPAWSARYRTGITGCEIWGPSGESYCLASWIVSRVSAGFW